MPINAHPDYLAAEKEYSQADSLENKIEKLKKMISLAPSHKGAENLRAQLKTRLKKFQEQLIKAKKSGKSTQAGIKKGDLQVVIIGRTNTGKSSLISVLTNAKPRISSSEFCTKKPVVGISTHESIQIQLIENPAIESENYDKGLTNSADIVLILIKNFEELEKFQIQTPNQIIVFNEFKKIPENEKRKLTSKFQTKKYNFVFISTQTCSGIQELKKKIFEKFDKIRVYTKEPRKEKSPRPIILKKNSNVGEVAEKILKGFSKNVKETKIWGPSSKFPGQKVGLKHALKDLDVVEFKTR
ncbi:MAG: 50S ribosome-binding GTPase [Nanoarchaeota archaeon]|nr:50S ribosome-binding GTPase [Nanoarchaeota archaeon]